MGLKAPVCALVPELENVCNNILTKFQYCDTKFKYFDQNLCSQNPMGAVFAPACSPPDAHGYIRHCNTVRINLEN